MQVVAIMFFVALFGFLLRFTLKGSHEYYRTPNPIKAAMKDPHFWDSGLGS